MPGGPFVEWQYGQPGRKNFRHSKVALGLLRLRRPERQFGNRNRR